MISEKILQSGSFDEVKSPVFSPPPFLNRSPLKLKIPFFPACRNLFPPPLSIQLGVTVFSFSTTSFFFPPANHWGSLQQK